MTGTSTGFCVSACTTPSATQSQRLMPAKMLTRTAWTFVVRHHQRKALATRSGVAPPPISRKFAGLAARQLDRVHRRHRQTGAVDDAADIAGQADIVEAAIGGAAFARVFLALVAQFRHLRVPEQRVVVEGHLGIERQDAVVRR